jgi:hypothetical protein
LVAVIVLSTLQGLERLIVEPLVPVFRAAVGMLDPQFVITDSRVIQEQTGEVVRFQANLRKPVTIAGQVVYPFGSHGIPDGGYEVTYTAGGVLQYGALLLIVALAFPAKRAQELMVRLLLCVAFIAALLIIEVPSTVVAELRHGVETMVDPSAVNGWMIWSRFLMGGGGCAVSIVLAALAISAGRRYSRPPAKLIHRGARNDEQESGREQSIRPRGQRSVATRWRRLAGARQCDRSGADRQRR